MAVRSDLPPSTLSNRKPDRGHVIAPVLALVAGMLLALPTSTNAQSHYTKISNAGYMLPSAAQLGDGPYDWACTRDNRTGLTWEVKRTSGLRDYRHNYAWRWSGTGHNGNTTSCGNTLSPASCNTQALASRYNGIALCGSSNWRVPLGTYAGGPYTNSPNGELAVFYKNLFQTAGVTPGIWFPNTRLSLTWTGRQPPVEFGKVWLVNLSNGQVVSNFWDLPYQAMLVTPDPPKPLPGGSTLLADGFESPSFSENFDTFEEVVANGWLAGNLSEPPGESHWLWGSDLPFPAHAGAPHTQMVVNFNSTTGDGTISNWLLTPLLQFRPGSTVSFYTRTVSGAPYADRLQVRLCIGQPCNTVGPGATGVSGFTTLLRDINPNLQAGPDASGANGYPDQWTRFELGHAQGVPSGGIGRIAFRYFVPNGGPDGLHSNLIGLDTVRIEATPMLD